LLVVILVAYSGAGGYSFQHGDYQRHNAFLRDLFERPWPTSFQHVPPDGKPGFLAFYIANSLPAAAVGKLFGWAAANFASFLWTVTGFYLSVCWFLRVIGRVSFPFGLLFIFFGGLDIIGRVTLVGWPTPSRQFDNWLLQFTTRSSAADTMEGIFWFFPSNLSFVYYAPQHVIGPWLCVLALMHDAIRNKTCRRAVFLWSLVLLWSAFSFVGLLPFLGLAILVTRGRGLFSFENTVAAGTVLFMTLLYLQSNNHAYPHGFLWQYQDVTRTWPVLLLFYALEFGIYALICPGPSRGNEFPFHRAWQWLAIACLLAAPWYVLGRWNDLTTKIGIPALVVFQIWLANALAGAKIGMDRIRAYVVIALLVIGSLASLSNVYRGINHGFRFSPPDLQEVRHTNRIIGRKGPIFGNVPGGTVDQLFSDGDAFFWKFLARSGS
jgi:hypothetical protein